MFPHNAAHREFEFDCTKFNGALGRFPFTLLRRKKRLGPVKGRWLVGGSRLETHYNGNTFKDPESLFLIGSRPWENYTFVVSFSFLTQSIKDDEGGVIVYFNYKNNRHHYSFHFCLSKQKIELWRRFRGMWTLIGEGVSYPFSLNRPYLIRLTSDGNTYNCDLEGGPSLQGKDSGLARGFLGLGAKYCSAVFERLRIRLF